MACGAQAQLPHVLGVWELNVSASKLPATFPAVEETRSYFQRDDGYLVVLAIRKDRNGRPDFSQIAAKTDGKDYPQYQSGPLAQFQIDGTRTPLTYAETVVDERTIEATAKFNGQVINKGTRQISADGKTMTLDVIAYGANGQETPILLVFDRRGD
jgi:hypothetical protein